MDHEEADRNALLTFRQRSWESEGRKMTLLPSMQEHEPHLHYYNEQRNLRFIWNGDVSNPIEVSIDSLDNPFGEQYQWAFEYTNHRPPLVIAGTRSLVLVFTQTCDNWIDAKEDAR